MVESTPTPTPTTRPGRPRSQASRQSILDATFQALVSHGFQAMSIDAIAAAAGVSKTTIYRWWSSKAQVAVDSFFQVTKDELKLADTHDAREDFRQQILNLARLLNGPRGRALAGMLAGARNDPELAEALQEHWLAPRRAWGVDRMNRAITDGHTHPSVTTQPALAVLYSPLYTPLLFGEDTPTPTTMAAITELSLDAIFVPTSQRTRP